MTNDKLLAILAHIEDEQWIWLRENYYPLTEHPEDYQFDSFADLAFRLRDEAITPRIPESRKAMNLVWKTFDQHKNWRWVSEDDFWLYYAKPIHWIIAALIAKETK